MTEEIKRKKNLGTYAVVMILAAVFLIIIAAMADHREDLIETQIHEQTQINVGIQDQIVRLEDENYRLKKAAEEQAKVSAAQEQKVTVYQTISEGYALLLDGKTEDAIEVLKKLDGLTLTQEETAAYETLKTQFHLND